MRKIFLCFVLLLSGAALWGLTEIVDLEAEAAAPQEAAPQKFRLKNRVVEFGFSLDVAVANDYLALVDFFQETFVIDYDDLSKGLKLDLGASISPFSLLFNWKDKWGFGFDTNVSLTGNVSASGNMLTFQQSIGSEQQGVGAAAFADFGIPLFFHVKDLKIKFRPAGFVPLAYTEPGIHYTYKTINGNTYIALEYDMTVYTVISLEEIIKKGNFSFDPQMIYDTLKNGGLDFSLGMDYPFNRQLDIGGELINVPLTPARLTSYMYMKDILYVDASKVNITDIINGKGLPDDAWHVPNAFDPLYGTDSKNILRPFKMMLHANYRPFRGSKAFQLIPAMGFSINPLYVGVGSFEGTMKLRCDLANMFVITLGVGYEDHLWKNRIDFVLFNLRALEFDIGITSCSQDFIKSFQAAGLGVNVGLKIGW